MGDAYISSICSSHSTLYFWQRFSDVNVVLLFNDSLIILAPESLTSLSVHHNYHLVVFKNFTFICSLYSSFYSQLRFSDVNVILFFNDSIIILAPFAPISLSVHCFVGFVFHFISFICLLFSYHHLPGSVMSM